MIAANAPHIGGILLIEAIGATFLAALTVLSWIAIGTVVVRGLDSEDPISPPGYLLVGCAITAFVHALFALAGMVPEGAFATAAGSVIVLIARRQRVAEVVGAAMGSYRQIGLSWVFAGSVGFAGLLAWLAAVAPPRSADAMRYHLAHIRLIVAEGQWTRIPDFHFALPFGWSLSYLPFELVGLPQGAQLLSFLLLVLLGAGLIRALPVNATSAVLSMAMLLPLMHPFVLRTFSEAGADPYAIYVVFAVALLLSKRADEPGKHEALAGFASWIGIQSRYQLVAVGIAAGIVFLATLRHRTSRLASIRQYALGSAAALLLASPFYVMNLKWFGNPVWPLMMSRDTAESAYPDLIAWHYGRSLTGPLTMETIARSAIQLVTWNRLFPIALLVITGLLLSALSPKRKARTLGVFGCLFLLVWAITQPFLYPKFVLLLLPVALLGAGALRGDRAQGASSWRVSRLLQIAAVALIAVNVVLSREAIAYAVTGDSRAYHEHTWFYPVYEWTNRNTPSDGRVLVIVSSGMTYYLDRPYRRADPWIGGAVDWRRVSDARTLAAALREGEFTHVIYEDRDWTMFPGGREMTAAVTQAVERGLLRPLRSFDQRLYTSRAERRYRVTRVTVFEVSRERRIAASGE